MPCELDALERACLAVAQIERAVPEPEPPPPPRPAAPLPPPAPRLRPTWDRAVAPPVANVRDLRRRLFLYAPDVAPLDGLVLGELELCLPRDLTDLMTWGRVLMNCLGDFVTAVQTGRSVVVGVRERRHLIGALEFRPDTRTLVQFVGARNRSLREEVTSPVLADLERRGLIHPLPRSARRSP